MLAALPVVEGRAVQAEGEVLEGSARFDRGSCGAGRRR